MDKQLPDNPTRMFLVTILVVFAFFLGLAIGFAVFYSAQHVALSNNQVFVKKISSSSATLNTSSASSLKESRLTVPADWRVYEDNNFKFKMPASWIYRQCDPSDLVFAGTPPILGESKDSNAATCAVDGDVATFTITKLPAAEEETALLKPTDYPTESEAVTGEPYLIATYKATVLDKTVDILHLKVDDGPTTGQWLNTSFQKDNGVYTARYQKVNDIVTFETILSTLEVK